MLRASVAEALLGRSLDLPETVNGLANRALDLLPERFDPFLIHYVGRHTIPRLIHPNLWLLYTMYTP